MCSVSSSSTRGGRKSVAEEDVDPRSELQAQVVADVSGDWFADTREPESYTYTLNFPCGVGKTEMALQILEETQRRAKEPMRILLLFPSLLLLEQFCERAGDRLGPTPIRQATGSFTYRDVRSWDRPSSGDPSESDVGAGLIVVSLYQHAERLRAAKIQWDVAVFDEAHLAFAVSSGPVTKKPPAKLPRSRIPLYDAHPTSNGPTFHRGGMDITFRLLLTATLPLGVPTDHPLFGTVLSLSRADAVTQRLISSVQLIPVPAEESTEVVRQAWSMDRLSRHSCIVFASRKADVKLLHSLALSLWKDDPRGRPPPRLVLDETTAEDRLAASASMQDDKGCWLFTCRCANVGLDNAGRAPVAVILTDPMQSDTLIAQTIGRAQRRVEEESGIVLVRVRADTIDGHNDPFIQRISRVLRSMC